MQVNDRYPHRGARARARLVARRGQPITRPAGGRTIDTADVVVTIGRDHGSEHLEQRVARYAPGRPPAGANREFRYLVNQDAGCLDVTQFVGLIAPGGHPPTDILTTRSSYTIDGEGILHLGGQETVIGPGSAMDLPPLAEHCLENTGKGPMRVLGVFHPSGDPASRAYDSQ